MTRKNSQFYDHRGNNDVLDIQIPMRAIAENICSTNYGLQRLLLHVIDIRKVEFAQKIDLYHQRGDHDVAEHALASGDPLMEGIEKLLKEGYY